MITDSCLIIGDIHLKPQNLFVSEKFFKFLDEQIEINSPRYIILLGDVYDTKAIIRSEAQNFLYRWCKKTTQQRQVSIIILTGNHDFGDHECTDSGLLPLKEIPSVTVVDKFSSLDNLGFVAFYRDPNQFLQVIRDHNWGIIFCHQEFNGFKYNSSEPIEEGVDLETIEGKGIFISGHIHTKQKKGNVLYLGTPYSISFGEANEQKVIGLLKDNKLTFIPVVGVPQHYSIPCSIQDKQFAIEEEWGKKIFNKDDFVKFKCVTSRNDLALFENFYKKDLKSFIQQQLPSLGDFQVHLDITDEVNKVQINESWSYEKMCVEYVENHDTKLDKKVLLEKTKKLLKEYNAVL